MLQMHAYRSKLKVFEIKMSQFQIILNKRGKKWYVVNV